MDRSVITGISKAEATIAELRCEIALLRAELIGEGDGGQAMASRGAAADGGLAGVLALKTRFRLSLTQALMLAVIARQAFTSYSSLFEVMESSPLARVEYVSSNCMKVQLSRIRRALRADGLKIRTVHGEGLTMSKDDRLALGDVMRAAAQSGDMV